MTIRKVTSKLIFLALALLTFTVSAIAADGDNSVVYVKQFPGATVGEKLTSAMSTCKTNASAHCLLILDSTLATYATGTMPTQALAECANCTLIDLRRPAASDAGETRSMDATRQTSGAGNNGIANSIAACLSQAHVCQVLAPALYAQTEKYRWMYLYSPNLRAQQGATTASATVLDQRWGGYYWSSANPASLYPYSGNMFAGYSMNTVYGKPVTTGAASNNYLGAIISAYQSTGGNLSQIYDNGNQSYLTALQVNSTRNTAEGSSGIGIHVRANSPGDAVGETMFVSGPGGATHRYDEGMELFSHVATESINVYRGTVASIPSSTSIVVQPCDQQSCSSPLAAPGSWEQIGGTQGDMRYLLDVNTADVTAITPTVETNSISSPVAGSTYGYFSSITSNGAFAKATGYGVITAAVTYPYGSETVTYVTTSGTMASSKLTCIADEPTGNQPNGNFETLLPAVSGSTFTASWVKSHPSGAVWVQGGGCGQYMENTADTLAAGSTWSNGEYGGTTTYPVRYPYPVVGSLDGNTLLVFTGADTWNRVFANAWSKSSRKAVNIYKGAEAASVAGVNGDTIDNKFTLMPGTARWTAGMAVEESHNYAQSAGAGVWSISQYSPTGQNTGLLVQYPAGARAEGNTAIGINFWNRNPWSSYNSGGGTWNLPSGAFYAQGPWGAPFFHNQGSTHGNVALLMEDYTENTEYNIVGMGWPSSNSGDWISYHHNDSSLPSASSAWDFFVHNYSAKTPVLRVFGQGLLIHGGISTSSAINGMLCSSSLGGWLCSNTAEKGGGMVFALNPAESGGVVSGFGYNNGKSTDRVWLNSDHTIRETLNGGGSGYMLHAESLKDHSVPVFNGVTGDVTDSGISASSVMRYCGKAAFSQATSAQVNCAGISASSHCMATWVGSNLSGGALGVTAEPGSAKVYATSSNSGVAIVSCSAE